MKDNEITCDVSMDIVFDKAIGESYSTASISTVDEHGNITHDAIWGSLHTPEYSMRIASPYLRRIKPWMALPTNEFVRFMNMRRQNKPYDKVLTKEITDTKIVTKGRKCYRFVFERLPMPKYPFTEAEYNPPEWCASILYPMVEKKDETP